MKTISMLIFMTAATLLFLNVEDKSVLQIQDEKSKALPTLQNSLNFSAKTSVPAKASLSLSDLEAQLKLYNGKNYEDFSQEELGAYNQLVLQRANILKKQIFNKAAKMGYYL